MECATEKTTLSFLEEEILELWVGIYTKMGIDDLVC